MQANLLAAKRRAADLTLAQVAKRLEIPFQMLWRFEKGIQPLPWIRLKKLNRILELKLQAAGLRVIPFDPQQERPESPAQ